MQVRRQLRRSGVFRGKKFYEYSSYQILSKSILRNFPMLLTLTNSTHCSDISIVDFEQLNFSWEAQLFMHLDEFRNTIFK